MSKTYRKNEYRVTQFRTEDGKSEKFGAQVKFAGIRGLFFGWENFQEWRGWGEWKSLQNTEFESAEAAEKAIRRRADDDLKAWEFNQLPKQTVVKDLGKLP